jgi:thioredoxin-like negative regulator of GroEL
MRAYFRSAAIGTLALAGLFAQAQEPNTGFKVRGEVSPIAPGIGALTIEFTGNGGGPTERATVQSDGTFEMYLPQPGPYEVRLTGVAGAVVHQEMVVVSGPNSSLSIRLNDGQTSTRPVQGTVSLHQLAHKVPPQARKAFDKAAQAKAKGRHEEATELFRQATSIDPEFADAFNELGVEEAQQGNLTNAVEAFEKAVTVEPDHAVALSNLSIALAKQRRYEDAASAARRALQYMPASGRLRFVLATCMLLTKGDSDEVLENLERSAGEIPKAHLVAARLLMQRGKRTEALQHVEDYLRIVPADDQERGRAMSMLAELRP